MHLLRVVVDYDIRIQTSLIMFFFLDLPVILLQPFVKFSVLFAIFVGPMVDSSAINMVVSYEDVVLSIR